MPRLLILTQFFPPEMGAPQVRLSELGSRLAASGWEVEALTALPNYPGGRVFHGYRPWKAVVEQIGPIKTLRVPLWPSARGFAARLGTYLTFAGSAALNGPRLCARPDLLWVESPPLFITYAAWFLATRWGCPYVLNVSDLWPESAVRMGIVREDAIATKLTKQLERSAYRHATGVTGQSQEILDGVRVSSPQTRTCLITNGVDPTRFGKPLVDAQARALLGSEAGPIFVYAGLFGHAQGLEQILDVAHRMPKDAPGRFVLVGEGPVRAHLEARIATERIPRVRIVGPQPRERIPSILAGADVALVTLGMAIPGAVPSKIYEAMASELPILLVAEGEPRWRLEQARAGLAVAPGDHDGLSRAVERLAGDLELRSNLGRNGREAAMTTYHRDRIAGTLDTFLRSCLSSPQPAEVSGISALGA